MKLKNRVAIVTGARRGIGRAIAETYAKSGANLTLVDIDSSELREVADKVGEIGRIALPFKADITNKEELNRMVAATLQQFGKVDILVNNAGIAVMKPFLELSEQDISNQIDVNLKGSFFCTQAVLPHMINRHYGKVINISSIAALAGLAKQSAYSASKAGIIALTKCLAMEMGQHNINVNAIAPGSIETEMTRGLHQPKLMDILPIKRMGSTQDVAEAALYLASSQADYVTGTTLLVDGGWSVGYKLD